MVFTIDLFFLWFCYIMVFFHVFLFGFQERAMPFSKKQKRKFGAPEEEWGKERKRENSHEAFLGEKNLEKSRSSMEKEK